MERYAGDTVDLGFLLELGASIEVELEMMQREREKLRELARLRSDKLMSMPNPADLMADGWLAV